MIADLAFDGKNLTATNDANEVLFQVPASSLWAVWSLFGEEEKKEMWDKLRQESEGKI
jgi:hypothetical protein